MSDVIYSTRRDFMRGTLGTLSLAPTLPGFLCRTALGLTEEGVTDRPILVVIQLAGGNDGLNTVVPYEDDAYYRARPRLAIPADRCLRLERRVGLHPALTDLKALYDDGRLAVVQGVGYPNPNRSHFRSMDVWHSGRPDGQAHSGWLGRYFDSCCRGDDPPPSQSGLALMAESPLALAGERFTPLALEDPQRLSLRHPGRVDGPFREVFESLSRERPAPPKRTDNPARDFLYRAALEARLGADALQDAARGAGGRGRPGSIARHLSLVAELIRRDFATQVYYLSFGGFDTHANQGGRHENLLREFAGALRQFLDRLREHKLDQRVVVMSFSEFGRRVGENASGGTDHGAAAPVFLAGSAVKPGVLFDHPDLQKLDQGDLVYGCDFRRVYASVLHGWLGARDRRILGGDFKPLDLLQGKTRR